MTDMARNDIAFSKTTHATKPPKKIVQQATDKPGAIAL
jgi:hypothetical protein